MIEKAPGMKDTVVIKTEGLSKVFKVGIRGKSIAALSDLNLDVHQGEIFGFLGPNGAGKTTTIKILIGLIYPSAGTAWILDRELGDVRIKERLGFLPEQPYFYDYLTSREFLKFYGQLFGLEKDELRSRIDSLLQMVGMKSAADLQLRKFSKGMLQRIGIAQALINHPDLIILDEPMSGLDPVGRKEIRDLILQLKKEGKTVFFSSHILPDVEMICDRVGILMKGRLLNVGRLRDIIDARVKYIDISAIGLSEDIVSHLGAMGHAIDQTSDQITIRVMDEMFLEDVLDKIRHDKGRIISVIPYRETLEEHIIKSMEDRTP